MSTAARSIPINGSRTVLLQLVSYKCEIMITGGKLSMLLIFGSHCWQRGEVGTRRWRGCDCGRSVRRMPVPSTPHRRASDVITYIERADTDLFPAVLM